jgi:hypothetical protein
MATNVPVKKSEAIYPWIGTHEIGAQTGQSRSTLRRWRVNELITEGLHWQYAPGSKSRIMWNRDLMRSWIACSGDKNQPAHARAIEAYLKSLPCTAA